MQTIEGDFTAINMDTVYKALLQKSRAYFIWLFETCKPMATLKFIKKSQGVFTVHSIFLFLQKREKTIFVFLFSLTDVAQSLSKLRFWVSLWISSLMKLILYFSKSVHTCSVSLQLTLNKVKGSKSDLIWYSSIWGYYSRCEWDRHQPSLYEDAIHFCTWLDPYKWIKVISQLIILWAWSTSFSMLMKCPS